MGRCIRFIETAVGDQSHQTPVCQSPAQHHTLGTLPWHTYTSGKSGGKIHSFFIYTPCLTFIPSWVPHYGVSIWMWHMTVPSTFLPPRPRSEPGEDCMEEQSRPVPRSHSYVCWMNHSFWRPRSSELLGHTWLLGSHCILLCKRKGLKLCNREPFRPRIKR